MLQPARRNAFTLIELLVVVSIIALLIAILLPSLANARKAAQAVSCASNVRQMTIAVAAYQNDESFFFPPHDTSAIETHWTFRLRPYFDLSQQNVSSTDPLPYLEDPSIDLPLEQHFHTHYAFNDSLVIATTNTNGAYSFATDPGDILPRENNIVQPDAVSMITCGSRRLAVMTPFNFLLSREGTPFSAATTDNQIGHAFPHTNEQETSNIAFADLHVERVNMDDIAPTATSGSAGIANNDKFFNWAVK